MNNLKTLLEAINKEVSDVVTKLEEVKEGETLTYAVSKTVRKHMQNVKSLAQNIRVECQKEFKKTK